MSKKIRRWKNYAKETLHGNYTMIILAMIAVAALNAVVSQLVSALFGGYTIFSLITGQAALFIVSLIMGDLFGRTVLYALEHCQRKAGIL